MVHRSKTRRVRSGLTERDPARVLLLGVACVVFACLLAPPARAAGEWLSTSGLRGAGLAKKQTVRAWSELLFFAQDPVTVLAPTLGVGVRLARRVEVEAVVPFVWANGLPSQVFTLGDPYLGLNYLSERPGTKWKLGAGVALGLNDVMSGSDRTALGFVPPARGGSESWLYLPETTSVVVPYRVEWGSPGAFTVDAAAGLTFPSNDVDAESELIVQLAPGLVTPIGKVAFGFRLPIVWTPTESGDNAQLAFEPSLRWSFGNGYLSTHFTLNIDEPLGFAFDDGKFWGFHVEVGGFL